MRVVNQADAITERIEYSRDLNATADIGHCFKSLRAVGQQILECRRNIVDTPQSLAAISARLAVGDESEFKTAD